MLRRVALGFVAGVVAAQVLDLGCTIDGPPRTVSYWVNETAAALRSLTMVLVLAAGLVHGGFVAYELRASGVKAPARRRAVAFGLAFVSGMACELAELVVTLMNLPPGWSVRLTRLNDLSEWPMSMNLGRRAATIAVTPSLFAAAWIVGAIPGALVRLAANKEKGPTQVN